MLHTTVRLFATFVLGTAAACAALAGCTIDPGPDLMAPAGCNAPPAFFVTDIWPKYFVPYMCGQSNCHDANAGSGYFRLHSVDGIPAPDPNSPTSTWPDAWAQNFMAVEALLQCSDPTGSAVLSVPSGRSTPHPPGTVVTDIPGADALFTTWLGGAGASRVQPPTERSP
jgi:hypothetical protein